MKVFHEMPLSLMHYAYDWTDGDYCLPHLLDSHYQYKLYFQKARNDNRFIILDNGLFEGVVETPGQLITKAQLIQPDIFIVPDVWDDSNKTLVNAKSWMLNYKKHMPERTNLMAVCQGETIGDLLITYQTLIDLGYKHIAFNHSSTAYLKYFRDYPILKAQMYGRMEFIRKLVESGIIRENYYHHLLGCSLPQEFMCYKNWKFINSLDTSNPILVGAEGSRYNDWGINWKPENKLEYYFEKNLEDNIENIIFNVNKIKDYVQ